MESEKEYKQEKEDELCGPIFVPPLYLQRYHFVARILDEHKVKSVVDLGCAECGVSRFLKDIESLERVSFIDIDKDLLDLNKFRIKPLTYDYLHKRKNPLNIRIYEGDVTEIDPCIMGFEAVTMIEFIEHLVAEDLEKVITAVFKCLHPKLVVMTTPNYEFNQLFPSYPCFRHYDHKFEWTRKQFQEWCSNICTHYNYKVQFDGIGKGPDGSENLGTCSQAAIFVNQKTSQQLMYVDVKPTLYKLIAETIYPYEEKKDLSLKSRLNLEINYYSRYIIQDPNLSENEDGSVIVPLQRFLEYRQISSLCDIGELRDHLKMEKYELTPDENYVLIAREMGETWKEDYFSDFHQDELADDIPKKISEATESTGMYPVEEEFWD